MKRSSFLLLGAAALCAPAFPAFADAYPARPITIVVPFPAGGGTDALIRSLAPALSQELRQTVLIDNKAGAAGTIGSAAVAHAAPDGYTLGVATTSTHAVAVTVVKGARYDPLRSFAPVGLIGFSPYVLVARPTLPAKTLAELIRDAKAAPGRLTFASVGQGSLSHLIGEQFKQATRTDLIHIPYKGASPAQTELMGGQVDLLFDNPATLVQQIRGGRIKALAQTQRSALLPEVPTFKEAGLPGFESQLWYGLVAPAGTPPAVVQKLSDALRKALTNRANVAMLQSNGVAPAEGTPAQFAATLSQQVPYWANVVKTSGVVME